jgi:hypothetical protein
MKKGFSLFLVKSGLFVLPVLIAYKVLYLMGLTPTVSDTAFFDYKMFEIQKHRIGNVKIMAIGSSMTQYSLNSEMIVNHFHLSYYNFASLGFQVSDMRTELNLFVKEHKPEYVIMCSSIGDFMRGPGWDPSYRTFFDASRLIRTDFPECFYLSNYSSVYEIWHRKNVNRYIKPDPWGGLPRTIPLKDIDQKAWNMHWDFPTRYTTSQYRELDSLAASLRDLGIKLIFIQSPIKAAFVNTPELKLSLERHFDTCRSIVEAKGALYLNYYDTTTFTDSLFFDQFHLQAAGGKVFTQKLITDIDTIIKH